MRAISLLPLTICKSRKCPWGEAAQDSVRPWGQCGGDNWPGPVKCSRPDYTCVFVNDCWLQCIPNITTTISTTPTPTTKFIIRDTNTTLLTVTTTRAPPTNSAGSNPTTHGHCWFWIRAAATPYYRHYLQAGPTGTSVPAVLGKNTRVGPFNVISGQLVFNKFSAGKQYMHVENPTDMTQRKLKTWFESTPNNYGTFALQGDALIWTAGDIARPNAAAWLVCEGDQLFVNTGAFLYNTPAGCFDYTVGDLQNGGGEKANSGG